MKKFTFAFNLILAFSFYVLLLNDQKSAGVTPPAAANAADAFVVSSVAQIVHAAGTSSDMTGTSTKGPYKDGTYSGSVESAYYGNVQVQAAVQNGNITGVQFLQYPNLRNASMKTNALAMPTLTREAIQQQSANVNIVTGATDTSAAFEASLGVALSQAH